MKKAFTLCICLLLTVLFCIITVIPVGAGSANGLTEAQLEKLANEHKFPYTELSQEERLGVIQYQIKQIDKEYLQGGKMSEMYYQNARFQLSILLETLQTSTPNVDLNASASSKKETPDIVQPDNSIALDMVYYGWNDLVTDARIINAYPEFLINNSPAGPWDGNADVSKFTSHYIMYFEYLDGGYEGTVDRAIPNDLDSNLDFIDAVANSGASGIFLDEVSDGIYTDVDYDYLEAIHEKAVSLGLLLVFNTGVRNWDPALEVYCDYIMGTESWDNTGTLTPSESNCTIPIWTLTQKVNARKYSFPEILTLGAWDKGIYAHYSCIKYTMLPDWLEEYTDALRGL